MKLSPVLSPDGRPMFSAGGNEAYKTYTHRGYVVSLEWIGNGRKAYAAMVIWPESNVFVAGEGAGMWAISRNCITEFVGFNNEGKCTGTASEHCIREARQALHIMGKDVNDKHALMALVDTVIRFAPDLVLMPATPKAIRQSLENPVMWEIEAKDKNSGKTLHEAEV